MMTSLRSRPIQPALDVTGRPCLVLADADSYHASQCVRLFRRRGWEVHRVASGVEALHAVRRYAPDAVIVDVDMPGENGWHTCARITEENVSCKVILLASELPTNPAIFAKAGASMVLSREECLTVLAQEIQSLLVQPLA